jgi:hypothetical protein
MPNTLKIVRERYEGVTDIPHFCIEIAYENCHLKFEDIYLDNLDILAEQITGLANSRQGTVSLNGGERFQFSLSCNAQGWLEISFRAEPCPFRGYLLLEGSYLIEGEKTTEVLQNFERLISQGKTLMI